MSYYNVHTLLFYPAVVKTFLRCTCYSKTNFKRKKKIIKDSNRGPSPPKHVFTKKKKIDNQTEATHMQYLYIIHICDLIFEKGQFQSLAVPPCCIGRRYPGRTIITILRYKICLT